MTVLKLNLVELLEKYKLQQDEGDYDSILDSELSGGKGKKRPKKPKRKSKKKKPKRSESDDYEESEESEEKGFFAKMFGSKDKSEDISEDSDLSRDRGIGRGIGMGMGMGRGMGRGIRLQEEVDQLKDTIAILEEKVLMLSNQLDNLSRKYN